MNQRRTDSADRRFGRSGTLRMAVSLAALLAVSAGFLVVPAEPARAAHLSATSACESEYDGQFRRVYMVRINGREGQRIGMVVLAKKRGARKYCAVVLRRFHDRRRKMNVRIKSGDGPWADTAPRKSRFYAGPVSVRRKPGQYVWSRGNIGPCWSALGISTGGGKISRVPLVCD